MHYVRAYWKDYLSMLLLGILGIILYLLPPAPHRYFPLLFSDGEIVYPEFAYPLLPNLVPIWLAAVLAFFIPAIVFGITQLRYRSILDFHTAILGLLYSLVTAAVFQVFIKWLIGGLRPHFYAACQPNVSAGQLAQIGSGYQGIMVDRSVCTGDSKEINDRYIARAFLSYGIRELTIGFLVWKASHPGIPPRHLQGLSSAACTSMRTTRCFRTAGRRTGALCSSLLRCWRPPSLRAV